MDNNNSNNNINYIYSGSNLIAEYDDSNNLLNEYIYFNGNIVALLRAGNLYYVYPDHQGNPAAIQSMSPGLGGGGNGVSSASKFVVTSLCGLRLP